MSVGNSIIETVDTYRTKIRTCRGKAAACCRRMCWRHERHGRLRSYLSVGARTKDRHYSLYSLSLARQYLRADGTRARYCADAGSE